MNLSNDAPGDEISLLARTSQAKIQCGSLCLYDFYLAVYQALFIENTFFESRHINAKIWHFIY